MKHDVEADEVGERQRSHGVIGAIHHRRVDVATRVRERDRHVVGAAGTAIEPVPVALAAAQAPHALDPPRGGERTLPPDTALLEFYLLPDGAAIADFSSELATAMPSGILSEQLALEAITRTLGENLAQLRRVKIVIAGAEAETLAGHVDLKNFIELPAPSEPAKSAPAEKSAANF